MDLERITMAILMITVGHFSKDCPTAGAMTCRNCGEEGHVSKECEKPRNPATVTCRNCDEVGHFSRDCPKPRDYSKVKCSNCDQSAYDLATLKTSLTVKQWATRRFVARSRQRRRKVANLGPLPTQTTLELPVEMTLAPLLLLQEVRPVGRLEVMREATRGELLRLLNLLSLWLPLVRLVVMLGRFLPNFTHPSSGFEFQQTQAGREKVARCGCSRKKTR